MIDRSPPNASASRGRDGLSPALISTVRLTQVIGIEDLPSPDATEDYHEASRMYPGVVDPNVHGIALLERSVEMRATVSRSVKRCAQCPGLPLPAPDLGQATLAEAIAGRRTARRYGDGPITVQQLSALLHAGYGVTGEIAGTTQALRTVPSGGALYPVEVYVACQRVDGAERALYHYDPLRHVLDLLRTLGPAGEVGSLTPYDELLAPSAAVVAMTAMFWRSRFKYGARAYRFALMEAGHIAQNTLLAATVLGLTALPLGGFYDRRVDAFLEVDGVHEAALYLIAVGSGTS